MCLGAILKEVNREIISCWTFIKQLQPIQPFGKGLKMGISHLSKIYYWDYYSKIWHTCAVAPWLPIGA